MLLPRTQTRDYNNNDDNNKINAGVEIDLSQPFRRVTMNDLVKEKAGGLDVLSYGTDLAAAKAAAAEAVKGSTCDGQRKALDKVRRGVARMGGPALLF